MKYYFHSNLRQHITNIIWLFINSILATLTAFLLTFSTNAVFELNIKKLLFWVSINILTWLLRLLSSYFQSVYQEKLIQKICIQIRENMSNKMSNETYQDFHQTKISQHISNYTTDISTIEKNYIENFYSVVSNVFIIITSTVALFSIHYILVLTTIILAVILLTVPNIFIKKLQAVTNTVSESNSRLVEAITNILRGFDVLYSYNKKSVLPKLIKKESVSYGEAKVNYTKVTTKVNNAIGAVNVLCQIILDIVTSVLAILMLVPVGAIASMGNIASELFSALASMGNQYSQIKSTHVLFHKLSIGQQFNSIEDQNLSLLSEEFGEQIRIKNLNYSVEGKTIFDNFNLSINQGDKVLVKGASGVGKSTLLKIIAGQITDYQGEVEIDGQNIKEIPYLKLNEIMTYIDQKPYLFSASVEDNVTLFKGDVQSELIQQSLSLANVDFIEKIDNVSENGDNLSVGQQQRIALARYYLKNTPIALLDEGTSALDHGNSVEVEYNLLKDKARTVIEVAHHFNAENEHLFTKTVTL